MTCEEFKKCLVAIGWSGHNLARALTTDERLVRRWAAGRVAIPQNVAEWLRTLRSHHELYSHPTGWEIRKSPSDSDHKSESYEN